MLRIYYVKAKCNKALNSMKVVSNTDWDAREFYRECIELYIWLCSTILPRNHSIHNQELRLALAAFGTSSMESK